MIELKENIVNHNNGKTIVTISGISQIGTYGMHKKTVIEAPFYLGRSMIETGYMGGVYIHKQGSGYR